MTDPDKYLSLGQFKVCCVYRVNAVTTDTNRPVIQKTLCHLAGTLITLLRRKIIYCIDSINLYIHIDALSVHINKSLYSGGCYMEVFSSV